MNRFPWGDIIDIFKYNLDGEFCTITKYRPRDGSVAYHCKEINQSCDSLLGILLQWIAYKKLGLGNESLAVGIAKALGI